MFVLHSNEARYVDTKLRHLFARVGRLNTSDTDVQENIDILVEKLSEIESIFDQKFSISKENLQNRNIPSSSSAPSPVINVHKHQTPVHQWNVYFSGDKHSLSVNAFIERVEEFRIARGLSEDELKNSIIELLKGSALTWYRSIRPQVQTWSDFVKFLRRDFLPFDYETDLWAEIRARNQGPNERISEFFACMLNLFYRLPRSPTEHEKLTIFRRNLLPYYIHALSLYEFHTVDELLQTCKKLEASRDLATKGCKPNQRVNLLEPDLAYVRHNQEGRVNSSENVSSCWNCKEPGHSFSRCQKPKSRTFCFRCGKDGVTKYTCSCNRKNSLEGRRLTGRRSDRP